MCPFSVLSYLPLGLLEHCKTPWGESALDKGISLMSPSLEEHPNIVTLFWYYSKMRITSHLEEMLKHLISEKLVSLVIHTGLPLSDM